ncbi:MAG: protein kinase [Candidatus Brocadiae bacterium]|nr:protein kinase [Candidatus Brocadiia bacterium]
MNDPWVGKIIGGCRLERLIGKGGMGAVYLAHQIHLDREIAIKLLLLNKFVGADSLNIIKRFQREGLLAAQLNHPNAVQIYDAGEENNVYYIIMQYIEGENLDRIVRQQGVFSVPDCLHVIQEVSKVLMIAHQKGIIHRDIKPANLLMRKDKSVLVTDFGLAKPLNLEALSLPGDFIGTLGYMSPEQARGEQNINPQTDIYSLGATAFYLLTQRCPFEGKNPIEVIYKHTHLSGISIFDVCKDIPLTFGKLITKMMEPKRENRFASVEELLKAISVLEKQNLNTRPVLPTLGNASVTKGRVATQILSRIVLPGEEQLADYILKALHIEKIHRCNAMSCTQEWTKEQIINKEAIFFDNKVYCAECLWKIFIHSMAGRKIGFICKETFGDFWLGIKGTEEFIPGSPILYLHRFPLKREKKGWENMLKRIERGFNLASKIHSPALFRVAKYTESAEHNIAYVPIEYIPGLKLSYLIDLQKQEQKELSLAAKLALLRKLAHSLSVLHKNNVVHRNLTPSSIHIGFSGGVRIGNFSMAKSFESKEGTENYSIGFKDYYEDLAEEEKKIAPKDVITTNIHSVLGTLSYMAPEQTLGAYNVDGSSDIWSWGVVAFELLEGKKLFPLSGLIETAENIRKAELPKIEKNIPLSLQKIIFKTLEKKKENRPSASSLMQELDLVKL